MKVLIPELQEAAEVLTRELKNLTPEEFGRLVKQSQEPGSKSDFAKKEEVIQFPPTRRIGGLL